MVDSTTGEIVMPVVRTRYNYNADLVSLGTGLLCEDVTRTKQQFKEEVDINTIVKRFGVTGKLPEDVKVPLEGDFTDVVDFHSAMNMVRAATEEFMRLPAHVRERFDNDPHKLQKFVENKDNLEEARKLGIAVPAVVEPPPPPPMKVEVVNPPPKAD